MKSSAAAVATLDFPEKIQTILDLVRRRPAMWISPRRLEFQLCALLTAWEAVTLGDEKAHYSLDLWREYSQQLHHGKAGLTLADPVERSRGKGETSSAEQEKSKAYQSVLGGLRKVYKVTRGHYGEEAIRNSAPGGKATTILSQLITDSFHRGRSFADPEGLEAYLVTLIELFETSLDQDPSTLLSRRLWRQEIQRKRALGPPATRTLADVTPLERRSERSQAPLVKERNAVLHQIVKSMQRIMHKTDSYLASRARRTSP